MYLYEMPIEKIGVLVHPKSIIHSLVRFKDGQIKAQLGVPDMRLAIQYSILAALETNPSRLETPLKPLDLVGTLELSKPDMNRFPCLGLAIEAGKRGGVAPVALNAADEVAVIAFLEHKLSYQGIPKLIEQVLDESPIESLSWDSIFATDTWARTRATELIGNL
jgi:1-deoxy-D-xylulose-5-phosphate reductoisomerase